MITQKYKLNIIPAYNGPVVVKCSQYDKDSRSVEFSLFDGSEQFILDDSYTVTVRGTKKDGTAFEYDCSIEEGKVVFLLNQQMTLFDGKYSCELRIINNTEILGSSNFTLFVEKSPIDEDSVISESDLPAYEQLLNDLQGEKISNWLEENITQETGYVLDNSLTVQGAAADAKAVGNALAALEEKIDDGGSGTGLTDEIAQALLDCFKNVAWKNAYGRAYYTALEVAIDNASGVQYTVTNILTECTNSNSSIKATEGKKYIAVLTTNSGYMLSTVTVTMGGIDVTGTYYSRGTISIPNVTGDIVITAVATSLVSSITAVFTQGSAVIYDTDSLDTLKQYLVVTANYSDGTSAEVTTYTLSGTLTEGTSTISVSYGGKTATFDVAVSDMMTNDILTLDGIQNTRSGHNASATTWEDLSGNQNDFSAQTSANPVVWGTDRAEFDATNRGLQLAKNIMSGISGTFTVELVINIQGNGSSSVSNVYYGNIFSTGNNANDTQTKGLRFATYNTGGVSTFCDGGGLGYTGSLAAKKTYIAYVVSGGVSSRYVDGILAGTTQNVKNPTALTVATIGGFGANWNYNGHIHRIGLSSSALTAEEVASRYQFYKTRFSM